MTKYLEALNNARKAKFSRLIIKRRNEKNIICNK